MPGEMLMKELTAGLWASLVLLALLGVAGCESPQQNCERACDRWVNQCSRWDQGSCMSDCLDSDGWGAYTDCIQEAPCSLLDELCDL
jgi:hypothetical protein